MTKTARLLLGGVVVATSAFAIRYYDGHDFIYNVWAPIHALLTGSNPYDPTDVDYFQRYPVPVVAGLYTPTALLLHAPLALLSPSRAADVMAVFNAALIWLGVLLLIPPRTARCLVAATAGALVIVSAPAEHTIELGQLSGAAFAGLALFVASLRNDASATWLPAIGVTLVALKPQSAIPILLALGMLGCWQVLARAAAILAVTSVPGAVLFIAAAGSPSAIIRTFHDNLDLLSRMPPADLAHPYNLHIDALGVVSHLNGPALTGIGWTVVFFIVATALFVLALGGHNERRAQVQADPYVVTLLALYIVVSLYHLTYDQLLLYVGPLAALAVVTESETPSQSSRLLAIGAVALAGAGLVFRAGFRARMIDLGLSALLVHKAWVILPTLIGVALVGCVIALDHRASGREPLGNFHGRIVG